jgi:hypothetical protein
MVGAGAVVSGVDGDACEPEAVPSHTVLQHCRLADGRLVKVRPAAAALQTPPPRGNVQLGCRPPRPHRAA